MKKRPVYSSKILLIEYHRNIDSGFNIDVKERIVIYQSSFSGASGMKYTDDSEYYACW